MSVVGYPPANSAGGGGKAGSEVASSSTDKGAGAGGGGGSPGGAAGLVALLSDRWNEVVLLTIWGTFLLVWAGMLKSLNDNDFT